VAAVLAFRRVKETFLFSIRTEEACETGGAAGDSAVKYGMVTVRISEFVAQSSAISVLLYESRNTTNDTKIHLEMASISPIVDSLVELSGIEPLTSSLRTRRSPS
jgi:hypothetical protein